MEKIGEITSDEPFLLVSTIRSSSPFPLQIVSLKYSQVKLCVNVPCKVNGPWLESSKHVLYYHHAPTLRQACSKNDCEPIACLHLVVLPVCPQQPDDVEDVGGIPLILSGRKFTTYV